MLILEDILISIIISMISGIIVATVFYKITLPKYHKIQNKNIDKNLEYLFVSIQEFDICFELFYELFEKEFYPLGDKQELLPPGSQLTMFNGESIPKEHLLTDEQLLENLKKYQMFDYHRQMFESYLDDTIKIEKQFYENLFRYERYLGEDLMIHVKIYFSQSHNYMRWFLKKKNYKAFALYRLSEAEKIIKLLKVDYKDSIKLPIVADFISKWENYKLGK